MNGGPGQMFGQGVKLLCAVADQLLQGMALLPRQTVQRHHALLIEPIWHADRQAIKDRAANAELVRSFGTLLQCPLKRRLIDLPDQKCGIDIHGGLDAQVKKMRGAHGRAGRFIDAYRMKARAPENEQDVTCAQPVGLFAPDQLGAHHAAPIDAAVRVDILHLHSRNRTADQVVDRAAKRKAGLRADDFANRIFFCII